MPTTACMYVYVVGSFQPAYKLIYNLLNIRYAVYGPYQLEYFWSGLFTLFHAFFHGNYKGKKKKSS